MWTKQMKNGENTTKENDEENNNAKPTKRSRNLSARKTRTPINKGPKNPDPSSSARAKTRSASKKSREETLLRASRMSNGIEMDGIEEPTPEITSLRQLARLFDKKFATLPTREHMDSTLERLDQKLDKKTGENAQRIGNFERSMARIEENMNNFPPLQPPQNHGQLTSAP